MADIALGVLAVLAGALLCFGGAGLLRIIFPIWGFFAGFAFGAGLVAGFSEEHFLGTVLGWVLGLVFALVFAVLAYSIYAIAVLIVMASMGFALGSGLIVALGIDWNWVAVLIGAALGLLLGVAALVTDLPMVLLAVVTSVTGAVGVVTGLMLVFGAMDSSEFSDSSFIERVNDDWWWYVLFGVLAVGGVFVQSLNAAAMRRGMRDGWFATTETPAVS